MRNEDRQFDIADFNASWSSLWLGLPPAAHRLRLRFPGRWVRFHTLPHKKRYATSELENVEILRRHHLLLDTLSGDSAKNLQVLEVITCSWSLTSEPTPRDQAVAAITPEAVYWRSDNLARRPEFNSWQHHYVSHLAIDDPALTQLLRCVANDCTDGVVITNASCAWVYHPYDGGMDVFVGSSDQRDQLAAAYEKWLPPAG